MASVDEILGSSPSTDPVTSFTRKWAGQPLDDSPTGVMQRIDLQRLKAGKNPLTESQTQRAITAATTREPVTPVPVRNDPLAVWSNLTSDITDLVKGIPQLPMAVLNEARALAELPTRLGDTESLGDIAQLPGIRMLPGAFTASALLPGGAPATDIAIRPVSTVLDLLPFANKFALGNAARTVTKFAAPSGPLPPVTTPAFAELAKAGLARAGDVTDLTRLERAGLQAAIASGEGRRIFPDLVTRRLARVPETLQSPLSPTTELRPYLEQFRGTPTGQRVFQLSQPVRDLASTVRRLEATLITRDKPIDIPVMEKAQAMYADMVDKFGDRAPAVDRELYAAIQDPLSLGVHTTAEARDLISPDLHPYFDTYVNELLPEMQASNLSDFGGTARRDPLVTTYRGEIYSNEHARRLINADERVVRASEDLRSLNPDRFYRKLERLTSVPDAKLLLDSAYAQFPDSPVARYNFLRDATGSRKSADLFSEMGQLIDDRNAALLLPPDASPADILLATQNATGQRRVSKGLLTPKEYTTYNSPIRNLRDAARRRAAADDLSARFYRTGSRMFYERAKANYERAGNLDPAIRQEYLSILDMAPGTPARRAALAEFAERVGPDTYRLVKYRRPDVDSIPTPFSSELWRQNIRGYMDPAELNRLQAEVKESLNTLRDNGYDPTYIPGVKAEAAARIDSTTVRTSYSKPDFVKARTFDYAPMNENLGVSVAYEAFQDWTSRKAEPLLAEAIQRHGISGAELLYKLEAAGVQAARRLALDPAASSTFVRDFVNAAKQRGYVQYVPEEIFPTAKGLAKPTADFRTQTFLPREFDTLIRRMVDDEKSYFQKMFDPVSKTFRTSVLLFSPAWHYNNILSGALMTAVANPRAFLYMADEWTRRGGWGRMLSREGVAPVTPTAAQARVHFEGMAGSLENELISVGKERGRLENAMARTQSVSRIWDQVQNHKLSQGIVDRFTRTKDFSLNLNAFWDDLFRAANFDAFEASTRRTLLDSGMPVAQAEMLAAERALKQAQTLFMDWTQFLPVERGILRAVFPFYAWTSHVMRLAFKLPFDHPMRVSVINNFTRAEIEDWQSQYPQIFRRILGLQDPTTASRFVGMNVDAFNPFRDIGNILTMGGMVASSNPIIQQVFRSVGVDPMSGGPEYAPNFIYDPTAPDGQSLDTGNPIINLAGSIVPQARALARWAGMDEEFRKLEVSNPAAANRALLSGLRLPIIYRDVDVEEVLAREEIKRFDAFRKAAAQAKEGNSSQLARFDPELAAQVDAATAAAAEENAADTQALAAPANPLIAVGRRNNAAAAYLKGKAPVQPAGSFVTM